ACSPVPPSEVVFAFKSSELSGERYAFNSLRERFGKVNPKCVHFTIWAYSDREEVRASDARLASMRGEAVKRRLVEIGFLSQSVTVAAFDGKEPLNDMPPGMGDPQNRLARVEVRESTGTRRCDPEVERAGAGTVGPCGGPAACYVELSDGTICNFDDVP